MDEEIDVIAQVGRELEPYVREFAPDVAGPAAKELGGLLGDRIRWWRANQTLRLFQRAKAKCDAAGIPVAAIRPGMLFPLLDFGAVETDPDMSERWAGLLASAATSTAAHAAYPEILRQLEPVEARVIDAAVDAQPELAFLDQLDLQLERLDHQEPLLEWHHLDNLERLRLLTYESRNPRSFETPVRPSDTSVIIQVTLLAEDFVRACRGPVARSA